MLRTDNQDNPHETKAAITTTHCISFSDSISSKRIEKTNLVAGWYNTLKVFLETPRQKAEKRYFSNDCCVNCYAGTKKEDLWAFLSASIVVYNVMPKKEKKKKQKQKHTHPLLWLLWSRLCGEIWINAACFCVRRAEWLVIVLIPAPRRACCEREPVAAVSNLRHCKDNDKTEATPPKPLRVWGGGSPHSSIRISRRCQMSFSRNVMRPLENFAGQ